jgi:hypothetical protein
MKCKNINLNWVLKYNMNRYIVCHMSYAYNPRIRASNPHTLFFHSIREYGNMGIWEYGKMGIWEYGNMGIWEPLNMGIRPSSGRVGMSSASPATAVCTPHGSCASCHKVKTSNTPQTRMYLDI